jgi:hypothetical protein
MRGWCILPAALVSPPFSSWLAAAVSLTLPGCGAAPPRPAHGASKPHVAHKRPHELELTPHEVVVRLRGNETDLRRCFFANPSARGAIRLAWHINLEGAVTAVEREESSLDDPQVEACLSERIGALHFGTTNEPAIARWTFVFRLVNPPPPPKHPSHASSKKKKQKAPDEPGLAIAPDSPGTLREDVIDGVVQAGLPLYARCYRDGIERNTSLDGVIRLRFVVERDGSVSEVGDDGSDLSDRQVVDCVAEGFYGLHFPEPQSGNVHVLYRLGFDAG